MFTQRNEEKFILKFFRDKIGRFLDIGAFDGRCFSTTHALALKGWSGVCVEPSPSVFPALKTLYKDRNDIRCYELAISDIIGEIDFYDCGGDMVSSVNTDHVKLWEEKGGCKFTKIKVNSTTMIGLLESVGYNFDFVSLDVEATNLEILKQFPLDKLIKMKMMCIEFDCKEVQVMEIVEKHGFKLIYKSAENLVVVR